MKLIFLLFISINVQAGLFDFFNIHQANKAYQDKDYKKAATQFSKIDRNDAARLNQANSLYKQGLLSVITINTILNNSNLRRVFVDILWLFRLIFSSTSGENKASMLFFLLWIKNHRTTAGIIR